MTTLFNILDGAVENAEMNDIKITPEYIEQYADNAMEVFLSTDQIETIWKEYNRFLSDAKERLENEGIALRNDWEQMALRLDVEV